MACRNGSNAGIANGVQPVGNLKAQFNDGSFGKEPSGFAPKSFNLESALSAATFPSMAGSGSGVPVSSILHGGLPGRPQVANSEGVAVTGNTGVVVVVVLFVTAPVELFTVVFVVVVVVVTDGPL